MLIVTEKFQAYDYGDIDNYKQYGQATPIMYELEKVTAPLALFYGDNDMVTRKAVRSLLIFMQKHLLVEKYVSKKKKIKFDKFCVCACIYTYSIFIELYLFLESYNCSR